jgi:RNA polymerase primary sigma factor
MTPSLQGGGQYCWCCRRSRRSPESDAFVPRQSAAQAGDKSGYTKASATTCLPSSTPGLALALLAHRANDADDAGAVHDTIVRMDESRAATWKALAGAAHRPSDDEMSTLLRDLEAGPQGVAGDGNLDELVGRAQAGDAQAREELIERLLPLVNSIARGYGTARLERADLVQEGCVGILRALQRFDPDRGVPFSIYAALWIRQALQELRSDFIRPLRLPPKALRQLAQLKSSHHRIYADEHRDASLAELSTATDIGLDQVEALLRADASARSIDEPIGGLEGQIGTLGDLLEDPLSNDQYEEALDSIAGGQLRGLLGHLTERERDILDSRFGFERPAENLTAIGSRLGISAERVRQIEDRALTKVRQGR